MRASVIDYDEALENFKKKQNKKKYKKVYVYCTSWSSGKFSKWQIWHNPADDQEFDLLLISVERHFTSEFSDEDKLYLLECHLDGNALLAIHGVRVNTDTQTHSESVKYLRRQHVQYQADEWAILRQLKHDPADSYTIYAARVTMHLKRTPGTDTMPTSAFEAVRISSFINGLPRELNEYLTVMSPTTLDKAVELAEQSRFHLAGTKRKEIAM